MNYGPNTRMVWNIYNAESVFIRHIRSFSCKTIAQAFTLLKGYNFNLINLLKIHVPAFYLYLAKRNKNKFIR